jgi:hypothetical protein
MASIWKYAFLAGILLAIILGIIAGVMPSVLLGAGNVILIVFIVLGLIVGFFNIKDAHLNEYLIAVFAVALVGVITIQQFSQVIPILAPIISGVFQNIIAFTAPSALAAGLKQIIILAYTKSN